MGGKLTAVISGNDACFSLSYLGSEISIESPNKLCISGWSLAGLRPTLIGGWMDCVIRSVSKLRFFELRCKLTGKPAFPR